MRDPAHIIWASCRDPLHDADVFKEQYERLCGKLGEKHAVLKDFMHSTMLQDQLEEAQQELAKTGASTPSLKSLLRHMAFVQPRFESFPAPVRKLRDTKASICVSASSRSHGLGNKGGR